MKLRAVLALALLAALAEPAPACRLVDLGFRAAVGDLQIVVWIETAAGEFVKTVYMTDKTGRYGIGNRPGRVDFNSEWAWPYGRRTTTFPVWAGRSPTTYPKLVFQDGDDDNLSHAISDSSIEPYFCRPLRDSEADAMTCATIAYTDKGRFDATATSKYPPRNDFLLFQDGIDHPDAMRMADMNGLDAISQPTPPAMRDERVYAVMPSELPDGEYVAFIEVSREFDQNPSYDYPSPVVPWSEYGRAYRGQPSVVWRVQFTSTPAGGQFGTLDFAGYGDPLGAVEFEGVLNAPDATITTQASRAIAHVDGDNVVAEFKRWTLAAGGFTGADVGRTLTITGAALEQLNGDWVIESVQSTTTVTTVEAPPIDEVFGAGVTGEVCCDEGSGALRLLVTNEGGANYRFKVAVREVPDDGVAPTAVSDLRITEVTTVSATAELTGSETVLRYDVRYLAGTPLTEANFYSRGVPITTPIDPATPGTPQTFTIPRLMPETQYWLGVVATDECLNASELTVVHFVTTVTEPPPVDSCACRAGSRAPAPLAAWLALIAAGAVVLCRRRRTK